MAHTTMNLFRPMIGSIQGVNTAYKKAMNVLLKILTYSKSTVLYRKILDCNKHEV